MSALNIVWETGYIRDGTILIAASDDDGLVTIQIPREGLEGAANDTPDDLLARVGQFSAYLDFAIRKAYSLDRISPAVELEGCRRLVLSVNDLQVW
jgi:hypothetical protein